jgi:hypothetical protein
MSIYIDMRRNSKTDGLPLILEKVQRCLHCLREMNVSGLSYRENPYCGKCLKERIAAAAQQLGSFAWNRTGAMAAMMKAPRKHQ